MADMNKEKQPEIKKNRTAKKIRKYMQTLEEEQKILGIGVKKRYIFIAGIIALAYLIFQLSTALVKPGMAKLENQEKAYKELLEENEKRTTKSFSEDEMLTPEQRYKQAVERVKNLSNDEIRALLKEQGVENITDAEIEQTRKNLENSIPKTQAEMDAKVKQLEEELKKMQGSGTPGMK